MEEYTGVKAQEAAEPAQEPSIGEEGVNDAASAAQQPNGEQSREERSAAAMARRRAEAEFEAKLLRERSKYDDFARMNGFDSIDEMVGASRREMMANVGLQPEVLQAIVNDTVAEHPAIQAAREAAQQAEVDRAFAAFRREFPDAGIQSVADFAKMPDYDAFFELVSRGLTFSQAYTLTHKDDIIHKRVAGAKQSALNAANGKSHLTRTQDGAAPEYVDIPKDTYAMYRQWFPTWSDKRIREHYAESKKE